MLGNTLIFNGMEKKNLKTNELRKTLSSNLKKQRKIHGLTQEKLAELTKLSTQTINDIEGCRMWVSDNTIIKLAQAFNIEAYQLFSPIIPKEAQSPESVSKSEFLNELEGKIIRTIKHQFEEANRRDLPPPTQP